MARKTTINIIILLVGLAGGIVLGFLMTQQKIKSANKTIGELEAQQAQMETDFNAANKKMSRMESELTKSRNNVMRKNTELLKAQTENAKFRNLFQQLQEDGRIKPATAAQTTTTTTPSRTTTRTTSTTPAGAKEYTIKDGDSLWKIAANELDNGIRYKEILELNPGMDENSKLTVDTKIKIPAK